MGKIDVSERLAFLAELFDVFEHEKLEDIENKCEAMKATGWSESNPASFNYLHFEGVNKLIRTQNTVIAVISTKKNKKGRTLVKVSVSYRIFTDMVGADPTDNKICLQWMLNTFANYLKKLDIKEAIRFAVEDLPQANDYLRLFEANKRKKKFKEMGEFILKGFKDITNINEYRNLSQLYDAVDPFIEKDPSAIESMLNRYVNMNQAEIPFRDRRYTVYIPKTRNANVVFNNFSSWCTAKVNNGMFATYTKNKQPNGAKSNIYIIIDNGFFDGQNENIYQVHFETGQIMNKSNRRANLYSDVLVNSEGLRNYFWDLLTKLGKKSRKTMDNNCYIKGLIDFGFTEAYFEFFDEQTTMISIDSETLETKYSIPRLPDISKFKNLDTLIIADSKLSELHKSIGSLTNLRIVSLIGNNIKELPNEMGNLKNLILLNLKENPLTVIPESIKYLDKSNGGNLHKISVSKKEISEANYHRLKELLPSVEF